MAAPELLHSAPEIPRNLSELGQLFSPDSLQHLSATLRSLGHPYGLLLQPNGLATKQKPELSHLSSETAPIPSQLPFIISSRLSEYLSEKTQKDAQKSTSYTISILSSLGPEISLMSLFAPCGISQMYSSDNEGQIDLNKSVATSAITYLALWYLIFKTKAQDQGLKTTVALITPSLTGFLTNLEIQDKMPPPKITKNSISLDSASLKLSTYRGQEPFTIKTPDGQPVTEIQPGSPLAALHVSHQAARFRRLSPFEKAQAIVADVTQLLSAIDQTDPQTLNPDQQDTLAQAQDATIIGISHLVRLFRRQTGLPTWKLNVLPPLLQRFHTLDSQAVSNQFGGHRHVKPDDIEMLVITPTQRRQLLANLQA